jgi:RHS repeat-associated protein
VKSLGTRTVKDHFYFNESWQELEVRKETSGTISANPLEQFVWHPYYIDALATRFYDATTGGTQVQHYFTHDANFNVTSAINTSGAVVERYDYTPYGQPFILEPNFSADPDGTDIGNGYLYTGRYYDRAPGLYHYRHRTYDPAVGTFLTRDPIGYLGRDLNLQRYSFSNPNHRRDPLGLSCIEISRFQNSREYVGAYLESRDVDDESDPNQPGTSGSIGNIRPALVTGVVCLYRVSESVTSSCRTYWQYWTGCDWETETKIEIKIERESKIIKEKKILGIQLNVPIESKIKGVPIGWEEPITPLYPADENDNKTLDNICQGNS